MSGPSMDARGRGCASMGTGGGVRSTIATGIILGCFLSLPSHCARTHARTDHGQLPASWRTRTIYFSAPFACRATCAPGVLGGGVYLVVLGHVSLVLGEGDGNVDLPPRRVAVLDQTAHLVAGRLELVLHLL